MGDIQLLKRSIKLSTMKTPVIAPVNNNCIKIPKQGELETSLARLLKPKEVDANSTQTKAMLKVPHRHLMISK